MRYWILFILAVFSLYLVWCDNSWTIKEVPSNEYPIVEQLCIDNGWEITTNNDSVPICLLSADEWCSLEYIENWECEFFEYEWDMPPSVYCEENWWEPQVWLEWGEESEVCRFKSDETFCYLNDFADWSCKQWDMSYGD